MTISWSVANTTHYNSNFQFIPYIFFKWSLKSISFTFIKPVETLVYC